VDIFLPRVHVLLRRHVLSALKGAPDGNDKDVTVWIIDSCCNSIGAGSFQGVTSVP
jgi:hypothetical protein